MNNTVTVANNNNTCNKYQLFSKYAEIQSNAILLHGNENVNAIDNLDVT